MSLNPTRRGAFKAPPEHLAPFCDLNDPKKFDFSFSFGLFRTKVITIGIQNPKLIVTNDYQQFLAHFEWFLAVFQISDVKPELLPS